MRRRHAPPPDPAPADGLPPPGLLELEQAATIVDGSTARVSDYQEAQRRLWKGIRSQGNPWLITDFVSFGSPMYFADRLYTNNRRRFIARIERREIVTCPPQNELASYNNINRTGRFFSWNDGAMRILHEAAPFA